MEFAVREITGKLITRQIKRGIVKAIQTEQGEEFIVRQDGKTAFETEEFDPLEGKQIKAIGTVQSHVLVVQSYSELEIVSK